MNSIQDTAETGESVTPVRKNIHVRANAARAFKVFTEGIDSWWPRTHHIGNSPMTKAIIEGRVGGRCYSEQADGTECPWGQVLVWEPPTRFVMAWMVSPTWQHEQDPAQCSEVEVRFTPFPDGSTHVELEHRYFERHGAGSDNMRAKVNEPGGWGKLLELFSAESEKNI